MLQFFAPVLNTKKDRKRLTVGYQISRLHQIMGTRSRVMLDCYKFEALDLATMSDGKHSKTLIWKQIFGVAMKRLHIVNPLNCADWIPSVKK